MIIYYIIINFINIFVLLNFVLARQDEKLFRFFKTKYNRVYKNAKSEQKGFKNFVNNMNKIDELNAELPKYPRKFRAYVMNRYTDLNPEEISEHLRLSITPCEYF